MRRPFKFEKKKQSLKYCTWLNRYGRAESRCTSWRRAYRSRRTPAQELPATQTFLCLAKLLKSFLIYYFFILSVFHICSKTNFSKLPWDPNSFQYTPPPLPIRPLLLKLHRFIILPVHKRNGPGEPLRKLHLA